MRYRGTRSGLLALLLVGCGGASRRIPADIDDELPPWMTQGEQVRIELTEKLLEMGHTQSALEILQTMRQEGFDTPMMNLLQGRALRMEGLFEESEVLLRRADKKLRHDPRPPKELCILYADAHTAGVEATAADEGEDGLSLLDRAVAECEKVVERNEVAADGWNNLGFLYLAVGRNQDALTAAAKAVEIDGTNALYRNNLALAQASAGRQEAAFRTFQTTLPRASAAYNVGVALERLSNLDGALEYYDRALSLDPQHREAHAARDRLLTARSGAPTEPLPAPPVGESP